MAQSGGFSQRSDLVAIRRKADIADRPRPIRKNLHGRVRPPRPSKIRSRNWDTPYTAMHLGRLPCRSCSRDHQPCGFFAGSLYANSGHSSSTTSRILSEIMPMCSTSRMYLWRRFRSADSMTLSPTIRGRYVRRSLLIPAYNSWRQATSYGRRNCRPRKGSQATSRSCRVARMVPTLCGRDGTGPYSCWGSSKTRLAAWLRRNTDRFSRGALSNARVVPGTICLVPRCFRARLCRRLNIKRPKKVRAVNGISRGTRRQTFTQAW